MNETVGRRSEKKDCSVEKKECKRKKNENDSVTELIILTEEKFSI